MSVAERVSERYLVAVSLGPVQVFIGAGRRSRDLWWGSQWLSGVTEVVAEHLSKGAQTLPGVELLQPLPDRWRRGARAGSPAAGEAARPERYVAACPNKVLAEVAGTEAQVRELLESARKTACEWFAERLEENARTLTSEGFQSFVDPDALKRQLAAVRSGDFVEFYAVWCRAEPGESHEQWLGRARALLAASKNTRLFCDAGFSVDGRPKSHLDPGRDSVFRDPQALQAQARRQFELWRMRAGVRRGEQLDAIGLARRLALFSKRSGTSLPRLPFPPLARVTADPWLRRVATSKHGFNCLKQISDRLRRAAHEDASSWSSAILATPAWDEWDGPGSSLFPFDASLLFDGGLDALVTEFGVRRIGRSEVPWGTIRALRGLLHRLHSGFGVPSPYYALLMFDGDRLGSVLERLPRKGFQDAQKNLNRFADRAAELLFSGEVRGCAFYVGGDEGLAYLPLDRLLTAIERLSNLYRKEVAEPLAQLLPDLPTSLSIGVAVTHVKFDLRSVRRMAGQALDSAKEQRQAACLKGQPAEGWVEVREMPRAGSDRVCAGPLRAFVADQRTWAGGLAERELGLTLAHNLQALYQQYGAAGEKTVLLARARVRQAFSRRERKLPDEVVRRVADWKEWSQVENYVNELLLAHRLAAPAVEFASAVEVVHE